MTKLFNPLLRREPNSEGWLSDWLHLVAHPLLSSSFARPLFGKTEQEDQSNSCALSEAGFFPRKKLGVGERRTLLRGSPSRRWSSPRSWAATACRDLWVGYKDWIELFIRNEKILSPVEIRKFHGIFTIFFCNFSAIELSTNFDIFAHICENPRNIHQNLEVK